MIVFLVPVADPARYAELAAPAIERVREADSLVLALQGSEPMQARVNAALDELAAVPDLEAVVFLHEDVVLRDIDFCRRVRQAFADPDVAIAGAVGTHDVTSMSWWKGVGVGQVTTPHVPAGYVGGDPAPAGVEALDGLLLALSPWAVRTLRFDTRLSADFHGYDVDLCFQARYHGRKVEVIELDVHHAHREPFTDTDRYARNAVRFQLKWILYRPMSTRYHQALDAGREAAR